MASPTAADARLRDSDLGARFWLSRVLVRIEALRRLTPGRRLQLAAARTRHITALSLARRSHAPTGKRQPPIVALDDNPIPWLLIRDHHVVSKRRETILVAAQPYGDAAACQRSAHRSLTTNQTPCVPLTPFLRAWCRQTAIVHSSAATAAGGNSLWCRASRA